MNTKQTTKCFASATLLGALVLPLQAQSALINDGDFAAWTFFTSVIDNPLVDGPPPNTSSGSAARISTGGNPDAFLQTTHTVTFGDTILTGGIKSDYSYNPAVDGPLAALSVSLDVKTFGDSASALEIVVEQGGIRYFSPPILTQFGAGSSANWAKLTIPNLTAANFDTNPWGGFGGLIPPDGNRPDFSATGTPLRFGVMVGSIVLPDGGGTATASHGIDNFSVTIAHDCGLYCDPVFNANLSGVLDPPKLIDLPENPPPLADARKRNVAVLVHGWNSSPAAWANDTKAMMENQLVEKGRLCSANLVVDPCWEVIAWSWEPSAATLLPEWAYNDTHISASILTAWLTKKFGNNWNHAHLIAHSAGSKLIDGVAKKLERQKMNDEPAPKSLHLTFLDPYTPLATDLADYGRLSNAVIPNFSESYLTKDFPIPGVLDALVAAASVVDPTSTFATAQDLNTYIAYHAWKDSKGPLANSYNIYVDNLDPDWVLSNVATANAWAIQNHAWPYQFYQCSISPENTHFLGEAGQSWHPCPDEHARYGFGFANALEYELYNTMSTLQRNWPSGQFCIADSTTLCRLPLKIYIKRTVINGVDAAADLGKAVVSGTGSLILNTAKGAYNLGQDLGQLLIDHSEEAFLPAIHQLDLYSGSPAWVRLPIRTNVPANYLTFKFKFTQEAPGILRAFIHGKEVWSADQRFHTTGKPWGAEMGLGELSPGNYEIAFRLDPLTDAQASVELTEISMGNMVVEEVENETPTAYAGQARIVRFGSVVTLDGSASSDPDNAPAPLAYDWSQTGVLATTLSDITSINPIFSPNSVGNYRFSLTVNDGANSSEPSEVLITVPRLGDTDMDGDVDSNDLSLVTAARNTPASSANDLRDLDGNMLIDALDARKLTTLCTRPRCATR